MKSFGVMTRVATPALKPGASWAAARLDQHETTATITRRVRMEGGPRRAGGKNPPKRTWNTSQGKELVQLFAHRFEHPVRQPTHTWYRVETPTKWPLLGPCPPT